MSLLYFWIQQNAKPFECNGIFLIWTCTRAFNNAVQKWNIVFTVNYSNFLCTVNFDPINSYFNFEPLYGIFLGLASSRGREKVATTFVFVNGTFNCLDPEVSGLPCNLSPVTTETAFSPTCYSIISGLVTLPFVQVRHLFHHTNVLCSLHCSLYPISGSIVLNWFIKTDIMQLVSMVT